MWLTYKGYEYNKLANGKLKLKGFNLLLFDSFDVLKTFIDRIEYFYPSETDKT